MKSSKNSVFNKPVCFARDICLKIKLMQVEGGKEAGFPEAIISKYLMTTDVSANGPSVAGFFGTRMMLDDLRHGLCEEKI